MAGLLRDPDLRRADTLRCGCPSPMHPCFAALCLVAIATAPPAQNPLAKAAARPFAGEFTGENIALRLSYDAARSEYAGNLTFQGQAYACSATEANGQLSGKFTAAGDSYSFAATRAGDKLTLVSDGTRYQLTAKGPRNPLANPSARSGEPPPDSDTPRAESMPQGGVGIAFRQNKDGDWVVEQVAPGGPASKHGLKPGTILHAVDGKSVDGLSMEQVRALVTGPIGSLVKLTMATAEEGLEVLVQRGALPSGQAQPGATPIPVPPAESEAPGRKGAPALGGVPPAPAGTGLPEWLKTGARATFYAGSATLPGVRTTLVEDDQGNWVDPQGRRYSPQEQQGTAGAGYTQYDFAHVGDDGIAVHQCSYVFMDAQLQTTVLASSQGLVGDRNQVADIWIHPARLAAMQEQESQGYRVRRLRYPLNNRTYNAISSQTTSQAGYSRATYDLDSGLLLVMTSSFLGKATQTPNPDGTSSSGAGATTIASTYLVAVRDLNLPWLRQSLPPAVQAGRQFLYRGTYANSLSEGLLAPWGFLGVIDIERVLGGFATGKLTTQIDYGNGAAPQGGSTPRVFGAGVVGPLFIEPRVLQSLQHGQVLDEDQVTGRRAGVLGNDGSSVTIGEQGPLDSGTWTYDLRSGMLVGVGAQQQQGPATITIRAQLQNGR
jgi:hypothetical protein